MASTMRIATGVIMAGAGLILGTLGVIQGDMGGIGRMIAGFPEGAVSASAHPLGFYGGLAFNCFIALIGFREILGGLKGRS